MAESKTRETRTSHERLRPKFGTKQKRPKKKTERSAKRRMERGKQPLANVIDAEAQFLDSLKPTTSPQARGRANVIDAEAQFLDSLKLQTQGNMTALITREKELAALLSGTGSSDSPISGDRRLRLQALLAEIYLLCMTKEDAARALHPFVSVEGRRIELNRSELDKIRQDSSYSPYPVGILLMQLQNLMYRYLDYETGAKLGEHAAGRFKAARLTNGSDRTPELVRGSALDILIGEQENEIWRARIQWRSPCTRREVESRLEEATKELSQAYNQTEAQTRTGSGGRLDLVLGIGLNLYALLEWNRSMLDVARRRIYRSLFLLQEGRAHDEIRLAHSLCSAARIEGSHSTAQFAWGSYLAIRSAELFGKHSHILRYRALLQGVGCKVKAGLIDDANRMLDEIREAVIPDNEEAAYVRAEVALREIWIHASAGDWQECLRKAKGMLEIYPIGSKAPRRLQTEALFQAGRAASKFSDQRTEGREFLVQALAMARDDDRVKIEAACELALAEGYLEEDTGLARKHWEAARRLGASEGSVYIADWLKRLAPHVIGPIAVVVAGKTLKEAQDDLGRLYVSYYDAFAGDDFDQMLEKADISRSTYYRYGGRRKDP